MSIAPLTATFTEAAAQCLLCPLARSAMLQTCRASQCMAWVWAEPEPRLRFQGSVYPDTEDEDVLAKGEPPRPADLPASWQWIEFALGEDDEAEGGYWEEPAAVVKADNDQARANRRGRCGMLASHKGAL